MSAAEKQVGKFLIFLPEKDVIKLDMSVEDGIKYVLSCGIVTPTDEELQD